MNQQIDLKRRDDTSMTRSRSFSKNDFTQTLSHTHIAPTPKKKAADPPGQSNTTNPTSITNKNFKDLLNPKEFNDSKLQKKSKTQKNSLDKIFHTPTESNIPQVSTDQNLIDPITKTLTKFTYKKNQNYNSGLAVGGYGEVVGSLKGTRTGLKSANVISGRGIAGNDKFMERLRLGTKKIKGLESRGKGGGGEVVNDFY
jgi:hypothetical protein